jgi:hypothetical protein
LSLLVLLVLGTNMGDASAQMAKGALADRVYKPSKEWKVIRQQGQISLYQLKLATVPGVNPGRGNSSAVQTEGTTELGINYPNPFVSSTTIPFTLGRAGRVRLKIYSLLGQPVAQLYDGRLEAGEYKYVWEAQTAKPGIYFYELETEQGAQTKKMTLSR